jgi:hypothetical protein
MAHPLVVGTQCECGPYSRESGYYRTYEEAESALNSGSFFPWVDAVCLSDRRTGCGL